MRGFFLGFLYSIGLLLAITAGGVSIYRAILFNSLKGYVVIATLPGIILSMASFYSIVNMLHSTTIYATEKRQGVLWKKPLLLVTGTLASSAMLIHLSGLSVQEFIKWIGIQASQ